MKDPVFIFMLDLKLYTNILMYLKVQTVFMSKTAKSAPKFNIKFHVVRAASLASYYMSRQTVSTITRVTSKRR